MHHIYGVAHGDLNPNNIVYDDNNEPYIIDFEKTYKINNQTWETELWIRQGYDWDESYNKFVNQDYWQWRMATDLDMKDVPRDYVSKKEEDT